MEAAPAGDRRGLRARGARPRAEERAEGDVDGRPRRTESTVGGRAGASASSWSGTSTTRAYPGDHRRHPDDARHAGGRAKARAGDDDVRRRGMPLPGRSGAGRARLRSGRGGRGAAAAAAAGSDPPATEQLIADGWGYASINPGEHPGRQRRRPDEGHHRPGQQGPAAQAGRLGRAARVGVGRVARRSTTSRPTSAVDAKKVGIEGVSRYGKAALVTMAYDQRFAVVLDRLVRRRRREAASPQLGRSGREPHRLRRVSLDGRQLPEVRRGGGDVRQQERRRPSGRRARADRALRAAARRSSATACPRRATRSGSISRAASWPPSPRSRCSGCSARRTSACRTTTRRRRCRR